VHEGALAFMHGPDVYKHVRRIYLHGEFEQLELTTYARKSSMLAILDIYSSATLADTTSTEMSLMTARAIPKPTKMLQTRTSTLGSDLRVRRLTWL
jgi:hypothetical protein